MSDASSCDETNLSRPRLEEASESHERLSHPSPSRDAGRSELQPQASQTTLPASPWAFLGFAHWVFQSCGFTSVCHHFHCGGELAGGTAGHADPVPRPGDGSWPHSCLEGALPSDPWDSRVTSWPPLGLYLPAISVSLGASSFAYSLGCWQSAVLGQAHHGGTCFRRTPTQDRHQQVVCTWGAWHETAPRGSHPAPGDGGSG